MFDDSNFDSNTGIQKAAWRDNTPSEIIISNRLFPLIASSGVVERGIVERRPQ